jgi:hypothetical protein
MATSIAPLPSIPTLDLRGSNTRQTRLRDEVLAQIGTAIGVMIGKQVGQVGANAISHTVGNDMTQKAMDEGLVPAEDRGWAERFFGDQMSQDEYQKLKQQDLDNQMKTLGITLQQDQLAQSARESELNRAAGDERAAMQTATSLASDNASRSQGARQYEEGRVDRLRGQVEDASQFDTRLDVQQDQFSQDIELRRMAEALNERRWQEGAPGRDAAARATNAAAARDEVQTDLATNALDAQKRMQLNQAIEQIVALIPGANTDAKRAIARNDIMTYVQQTGDQTPTAAEYQDFKSQRASTREAATRLPEAPPVRQPGSDEAALIAAQLEQLLGQPAQDPNKLRY